MTSLRRRLWSTVAIGIGVLLVLTGLAAPAQALTTRSISFAAKPTAAVSGSTFTFYGYLSKSPIGSTVKLQRKSGTSWVTSTLTKTKTSSGYFSFKTTASSTAGTYSYRAAVSATSRLSAATSKTVTVTALRKVAVTIKASPSTITSPRLVTISGTVKPFVSGDVGFVQRFNGAKWIDLTTATISRTGTYSRAFTTQATTTYRFYVPRQGLNASGVSASAKVTFDTGPKPPVITTTSLPGGLTDTTYSQTLTKTGDAGTWAVTSGALPPGLTLGSSSGTIAGTPTAGGTFNFTVTFSQSGNLLYDTQALSITVRVKPRIATTALPPATAYSSYSTTLDATGQPGTWSVASGTLPTGVTLDGSTGTVSGKPTVAGSYPLTFRYTETTSGLSVTKSLPLTVNPAPAPVIGTTSLPNATAFSNYTTTLTVTGKPGTWTALSADDLPTGVSFNTTTGVLSGRPTVSGDFSLTFKFTETETGLSASKTLNLHVNAAPNPVINTSSLPEGTAFSNYSATLTKTGNAGTWSIASGALPAGVSLNGATGTISGRPTVSGDFGVTVKFTETESGTFATKALTLHLDPAPDPVITSTSPLPIVLINASYSVQLTKTGNAGTWSVTGGALPTGLTLSAGGLVSGSPTVSGTFTFAATFTEDESGTFDTKSFSIQVYSRPTVTTVGLPDGWAGHTYSGSLTKTGGSGSGTWSILTGSSLPSGITLSASGVLGGTAPASTDDYTFTVKFSDSVTGASATKVLTIHVGQVAIFTAAMPDAKKGTAYSVQLDGAPDNLLGGGWSLSSGSLPPGVSLNQGSGLISGTPTAAGDYTFSISYFVALKGTRTRTYTLHVNP